MESGRLGGIYMFLLKLTSWPQMTLKFIGIFELSISFAFAWYVTWRISVFYISTTRCINSLD